MERFNIERTKNVEQTEANCSLNHRFEKSTHTEKNSNGPLEVILRIFVVKNTDVIQLIFHQKVIKTLNFMKC